MMYHNWKFQENVLVTKPIAVSSIVAAYYHTFILGTNTFRKYRLGACSISVMNKSFVCFKCLYTELTIFFSFKQIPQRKGGGDSNIPGEK